MFNSIRIRLTLWYLSILALIIIAFAFAAYFLIERNLNKQINDNLLEIAGNIEADLKREDADIAAERLQQQIDLAQEKDKAAEPDEDERDLKAEPEEPPATIEEAIAEEIGDLKFNDYGFFVLGHSGQEIASSLSDEVLKDGLRAMAAEAAFTDLQGKNGVFRICRKTLTLDGKPFQFFVSRSLREQEGFLGWLRNFFYLAVPLALFLAGLGGYFLARRSLAPIVSMSRQAEKIGSSNLDERLPIKNENDELGGLAKVFNALLSRLESSFEQQCRFVADASHELRTPLAIVRTESEVALSKNEREAGEYRESLKVIHEESKHLTNIVESLFLLARADSGELRANAEALDLGEVLREAVKAISILAKKKNVKVAISPLCEMPLEGDRSLLHRLFLNLLDNAVKYNKRGGSVSISAESGEKHYRIIISDNGPGISKEDQAKIFERFYRIDKARSRKNAEATAGAGLGLSIAARIAEIHSGSITLEKSDPEGSVFSFEIPKR